MKAQKKHNQCDQASTRKKFTNIVFFNKKIESQVYTGSEKDIYTC